MAAENGDSDIRRGEASGARFSVNPGIVGRTPTYDPLLEICVITHHSDELRHFMDTDRLDGAIVTINLVFITLFRARLAQRLSDCLSALCILGSIPEQNNSFVNRYFAQA